MTSQVGRQCLVDCVLGGHALQALWDTGSPVSIIDEEWKREHFPNSILREVTEILDSPDDLKVTAAKGPEMPYLGCIETTFRLASETGQTNQLIIPVLVMKGCHLSHILSRVEQT